MATFSGVVLSLCSALLLCRGETFSDNETYQDRAGESHWSKLPHLFESTTLPQAKYMPEVGNGVVATMMGGPCIYMNGLYNGNGTRSSRACIASLLAIQLEVTSTTAPQLINTTYVLNVKEGTYREERTYDQPRMVLRQTSFAHRRHKHILSTRVEVELLDSNWTGGDVAVRFVGVPDQADISTVDLQFQATKRSTTPGGKTYSHADGLNRDPELPDTPKTTVTVAWTPIPQTVTISAGQQRQSSEIVVAISMYRDEAVAAITAALDQPFEQLMQSHVEEWASLWSRGMIEVDPKEDFRLAQAIHASFYYLMSSIPNEQDPKNKFIGLSPGGLSRGRNNTDYSGHVFWDQETWMYPPVLYFHPHMGALMIDSRARTLNASIANARAAGLQGARYAWESAVTGTETSPWPESGIYQVHITADIAFAVRQLLYLAENKVELINQLDLRRMSIEMAEFWVSRSVCDDSGCHIRGIMPPDEYHYPVDDSVFTNYNARLSLEMPAYILGLVGETHSRLSEWQRVADALVVPTSTFQGRIFHPEFEGYKVGEINPQVNNNKSFIKQADVILLGFPLGMEMSEELRRNDLDIYYNVTDAEHGPAMTWGMFSVGYTELGQKADADRLFEKNFENVVEPFGVWSEVPRAEGALNFLTGMGGFLQAIVNGYGGLRLFADHISFDPHQLVTTKKWSIKSFDYLGNELDLHFDFVLDSMHISCRDTADAPTLVLVDKEDVEHELTDQLTTLPMGKFVIRRGNDAPVIPTSPNATHWSRMPHLFESTYLPQAKYMPEVGNGVMATMMGGPCIYMNGLYNGNGTRSSRACIASLLGFQMEVSAQFVNVTYVLNVKEGAYMEERLYDQPRMILRRTSFAHRRHKHILSTRVEVELLDTTWTGGNVTVRLTDVPNQADISTVDLLFDTTKQSTFPGEKQYWYAEGKNREPELPGNAQSTVTVAWTPISQTLTISAGQPRQSVEVVVAISMYSNEAHAAIIAAQGQPFEQLMQSHVEEWASLWSRGMIEVDPKEDFRLAQTIHASFYYLMSSIPNEQDPKNKFIGLSPGGLSRGRNNTDYSGHVFWDQETWMYPPVLYFHPHMGALMVDSRVRTLDASIANAKADGLKGARYAWESAVTGTETSPWPPSGLYQVHVTADIAFAVRQLLYLADNKVELINQLDLRRMSTEMAEFWVSRSECDNNGCHIRGVMPPDEYHYPVDDSVFTNYNARLSLEMPAYILGLVGETHSRLSEWQRVADALVVPTSTFQGKIFHPEFEGYKVGEINPQVNNNKSFIKQADVILLGFPLGMEMSTELRKNDLDIYYNVTDAEHGPAMTWGMFSVGYLELGQKANADRLFEKNFENVVEPFGIWSEVPRAEGALNFLTGMGGFLQAIVNGYGGLRLFADHISFDPHQLVTTKKWSIKSFDYLGNELDLHFDFVLGSMHIACRKAADAPALVAVVAVGEEDVEHELTEQLTTLPIGKFVIRPPTTDNGVGKTELSWAVIFCVFVYIFNLV